MSLDEMRRTPLAPASAFDELLSMTEGSFVLAGSALEGGVEQFQALRALFELLEKSLGPEANSALSHRVGVVSARGNNLRADFGKIAGSSQKLRRVVTGIRGEVRGLNTIAKLIANISINARIHGNSLSRPRPQIKAFVETLANLSAEAETILSDVNISMDKTLGALGGIEAAQVSLSDDLRRTTFPAIERFTEVARAISDEQEGLRESSVTIAEQMQHVSRDVARLVTSFQIGDTLRQRLEQVHAALNLAEHDSMDSALAYRLAGVLAEGALRDATPPIDEALTALHAVSDRGKNMIAATAFSTFADHALRRSQTGQDHFAAFEDGLGLTQRHFGAMQAGANMAQEQIQLILAHDSVLQRISQHLRMAGINAVIACAKLGEEGRALRELAQWLRSITDECESTMLRLQAALTEADDAVHQMSDELIAGLDADLSDFLGIATDLGSAINGARGVLASASGQFDAAASDLDQRLQVAISALLSLRERMRESGPTIQNLFLLSGCFPRPDLGRPETQAYLATLRRKYTMSAERTLHDALVARCGATDEAGPSQASQHFETPPPTHRGRGRRSR